MDRRTFLGGAIIASSAFCEAKDQQQKGEIKSSQYAIVELLGYKKLCGRLSQGLGGLLQLDVPVAGGFVTKLINTASIYAITIVDEATVKAYAASVDPLPALELEIPARQRSFDDDFGRDYDDGRSY